MATWRAYVVCLLALGVALRWRLQREVLALLLEVGAMLLQLVLEVFRGSLNNEGPVHGFDHEDDVLHQVKLFIEQIFEVIVRNGALGQ